MEDTIKKWMIFIICFIIWGAMVTVKNGYYLNMHPDVGLREYMCESMVLAPVIWAMILAVPYSNLVSCFFKKVSTVWMVTLAGMYMQSILSSTAQVLGSGVFVKSIVAVLGTIPFVMYNVLIYKKCHLVIYVAYFVHISVMLVYGLIGWHLVVNKNGYGVVVIVEAIMLAFLIRVNARRIRN